MKNLIIYGINYMIGEIKINYVGFQQLFKTTKKYDLITELNLNPKDITYGLIAGGVFDFFTTGYTIPIGTIIGASLSTIKINAKATMTFAPASGNNKLSYLSNASKENILTK